MTRYLYKAGRLDLKPQNSFLLVSCNLEIKSMTCWGIEPDRALFCGDDRTKKGETMREEVAEVKVSFWKIFFEKFEAIIKLTQKTFNQNLLTK